jgi:hypothetical protein
MPVCPERTPGDIAGTADSLRRRLLPHLDKRKHFPASVRSPGKSADSKYPWF